MTTDNVVFSGKTVEEAVAEGLRVLKLSADQVEIEVVNKGSRGIFGLGSEPAQVRLQPRSPLPAGSASRQPPPSPTVSDTVEAIPPTLAEQPAPAAMQERATPEQTVVSGLPADQEPAADDQSWADEETPVSDEEVETIAMQLLSEAVRLMGFEATVETTWREGNDELSEHSDRYLLLDVQGNDLGALIGRRGEGLENLQYLLRLMVNQRLRRWKNIVVDVEGYKERRINQLKQLAQR
nr:Jag N-terminal domain-containing protein [Caldilineaceae bacterium]